MLHEADNGLSDQRGRDESGGLVADTSAPSDFRTTLALLKEKHSRNDDLIAKETSHIIGAWRSLVAHLHGVQGVGGSNPLAPTLYEFGIGEHEESMNFPVFDRWHMES